VGTILPAEGRQYHIMAMQIMGLTYLYIVYEKSFVFR
jgi:hypothetical protein